MSCLVRLHGVTPWCAGIQSRFGGAITAAMFLKEFVNTEKAGPPAALALAVQVLTVCRICGPCCWACCHPCVGITARPEATGSGCAECCHNRLTNVAAAFDLTSGDARLALPTGCALIHAQSTAAADQTCMRGSSPHALSQLAPKCRLSGRIWTLQALPGALITRRLGMAHSHWQSGASPRAPSANEAGCACERPLQLWTEGCWA